MKTSPDYTAVIDRVCRHFRRLTPEQRTTRIGIDTPTVAEIVRLITKDEGVSLREALETPLNGEKLYHVGQLMIILDILTQHDKRSVLVRWF